MDKDFMELMGKMAGRQEDPFAPSGKPSQMLSDLEDTVKTYKQPNPYSVGDIVTPRDGANVRGRGKPFYAFDVRDSKVLIDPVETGRPYEIMDMVVGFKNREYLVMLPANSTDYEPWTEDIAKDAMR